MQMQEIEELQAIRGESTCCDFVPPVGNRRGDAGTPQLAQGDA
jgi:hypothetical protein